MTDFEQTRNADRVREIVQSEIDAGRSAKLRAKIDLVTENIYSRLPSGDYGRGDVRRVIMAELDQV